MKPTLTLLTLSIVSGLTLIPNAFARETDVLDYAIGGGPVISLPAREDHIKTAKLGLGWDANLQCGQLDPKLTVENQLNGITEGFQDMMGNVMQSATSAVASLPGYLIQKEDPGLYDLLTNGVLQGKFDFDDALTSCEAMTETMGETIANSDYYAQAKAELWAKEAKSGDAVQAKQSVLDDMGNSGITWRGGISAGGRGQPTIKPTEDSAIVGFEMLAKTGGGTGTNGDEEKTGLYRFWDSPDALSEWVASVVGSQSVQTGVDQSQVESTAGIGLSPEVVTANTALTQELEQAITDKAESEHFPLALVTALSEGEATTGTKQRITSELALAHTIEKALMARRALLAGKQEVYIAQNKPAQESINDSVAILEDEINALRFEAEARQTISSLTATRYMQAHYQKRNNSTIQEKERNSAFLNEDLTTNKESSNDSQ
ncbi:integrating conjugative element protein [Vibrio sp. 10N.261.46.A3]|uniref:integrating conjugative element protein n=1 Tax=Vibrio sp. 10N.261.46.A3 TaxID=3229658 RepID=UPI00354E6CF8